MQVGHQTVSSAQHSTAKHSHPKPMKTKRFAAEMYGELCRIACLLSSSVRVRKQSMKCFDRRVEAESTNDYWSAKMDGIMYTLQSTCTCSRSNCWLVDDG